ncbi:MAG TPA: HK97 gp10 family phage protein [Anaerolineae bacterium]|nr:HK97 gp10 family phage protein [Anaerolineae bacterium]
MPRKYRLDKLDMPDLEAMEPAIRKTVLREGLNYMVDYLRGHVPDSGVKHKGKLNKSITQSVVAGGLVGKVRAKAPHAHLVHEGTKGPRKVEINPSRQPPALALLIPGVGYRHSAEAGKMPANPFVLKAADDTRQDVEDIMRVATEAAAAALAEGVEP